MFCWCFVHAIVVPWLHCLYHGWLLCDLLITQQERERERESREINRREKKLNRVAASPTIGRAPERGRPQLTEPRVRNLMVVVMFADVPARVPVTLDGAVAYTRWQEAIGAAVDYLLQFSGFEPSNKVTTLTTLAFLI
ncbi:hypothetical protein HanLR1_Chr06g0213921 [Helianthus annuus]|nr:hypothetical protein HanLR1_Chr06g0213921 [Helianthus annuus]